VLIAQSRPTMLGIRNRSLSWDLEMNVITTIDAKLINPTAIDGRRRIWMDWAILWSLSIILIKANQWLCSSVYHLNCNDMQKGCKIWCLQISDTLEISYNFKTSKSMWSLGVITDFIPDYITTTYRTCSNKRALNYTIDPCFNIKKNWWWGW